MYFKKLLICGGFNAYAGWDNNGNVYINPTHIVLKKYYGINITRIRTITKMVDHINIQFLTEFLCMELSKGIGTNVECKGTFLLPCTPNTTAFEMCRKDIRNVKRYIARKCILRLNRLSTTREKGEEKNE